MPPTKIINIGNAVFAADIPRKVRSVSYVGHFCRSILSVHFGWTPEFFVGVRRLEIQIFMSELCVPMLTDSDPPALGELLAANT